jgi:hypothetical protein
MFSNYCFGMTCNSSAIFNTKTWKTKCLLQLLWLLLVWLHLCVLVIDLYTIGQVVFRVQNNMQLNIGISFCIEGGFLTMANGQ